MPSHAPHLCSRCRRKVPYGERCACQPTKQDMRPSARKRGYDREWQDKAAAYLKAHPRCTCGKPATVVAHVQSIRTRPDLRLDPRNWRPSCHSCNAVDAHREKKDGRGVGRGLAPIRRGPPASTARNFSADFRADVCRSETGGDQC